MIDIASVFNPIKLARQLRIAVVRNVLLQDKITVEEAKILLCRPLTPGDYSTFYDDSALIEVDDALEQIAAEYTKEMR